MTEPVVAVVVAAGSGSRLGASVPKALVDLDNVPLVRHSVLAMLNGGAEHVAVTIPAGFEEAFAAALDGLEHVTWTHGGAERQDSVRLGLEALAPHTTRDAIVLIHDAARPLVPAAVVAEVARAVADGAAAAIPVVPVHDTIRAITPDGSEIIDRSQLRAVQTPQGFRLDLLRVAHAHVARRGVSVTDDAAAVEALGHVVEFVSGHRDSMKITEAMDLVIAHAILAERHSV